MQSIEKRRKGSNTEEQDRTYEGEFMKILLVTLDSKFIHANLAVRYLEKYCRDEFDIEIKEFTINQKQEYILGKILAEKADLICFSSYVWNIEYIKELAYIIKEAVPTVDILCGGPEVSFEIEKFMKAEYFVDYVIFGEGEESFREFLREYHKPAPEFRNIKGLAYREKDKIAINESREPIEILDDINYPYEEDDKFEDKIIYYESSRGCPFSCSFCMSSIERKMRVFSMERVKRDLKRLLNTGARQIKFVDRTFNADYRRSMEIMDFIIKHNTGNMTIHFEITADIINDEFLEYIKNLPVNMFQFEIGVQSLKEETLCEINRRMDVDRLSKVIQEIGSSRNVHIHLDLIAGLPFEGYDDFKKSFDGIHILGAEKVQLGFLKVLKGTKIYEDVQRHGIKYRGTSPYEVICTKYISAEELLKLKNIEELVERYYNEKYFEKSLNHILSNIFTESPFEFYEDFSMYWQREDLYRMSHSRKKLYKILFEYMRDANKTSDEFIWCLKYDYVFNNQFEDLPDYLDRESEDRYKAVKRYLSNDMLFKETYFTEEKIANLFRLVNINNKAVLFIYKDKDNIFNRCETYVVDNYLEEIDYEQKG